MRYGRRLRARAKTDVQLEEWVAPDGTDEHGLLQAGKLLEWMDVIGAVAATRHCRHAVVTAAIDGLELHEPIRGGERVSMRACVAYASDHSVGISVTTNVGDRPALHAYLVFVPLDRRGRPLAVPAFVPETDEERARHREGEQRRAFRKQLQSGELELGADHPPPDVREHEWPMLLRTWMRRLPRYLHLPWDFARPRRSFIHRLEPVQPGTLGSHGTASGGNVMRWAEEGAHRSARTWAGVPVRCSGLHGMTFLRPIERDRFVHIRAAVVHGTATTLTAMVSVHSEDAVQGAEWENLRAFFTYVPVDAAVRLPAVERESAEERALYDEVELRLALQRALTT